MQSLYFPEELYILAHMDYLEVSGKDVKEVHDYCAKNVDFFVEVVFSYVENSPYPKMKEQI